jgi:hypothetical protein
MSEKPQRREAVDKLERLRVENLERLGPIGASAEDLPRGDTDDASSPREQPRSEE